MTKAFEDKELIEVFTDGVSRAIEAIKPSEFLIMHFNGNEFVDGLKKAATAANGLAHAQANPTWMAIRDSLEMMVTTFKQMIMMYKQPPRAKLESSLRRVLSSALIMANAKSMARQDVLVNLDERRKHFQVN